MQIQGKYRCINCFNELNTENEICSCGYDKKQYKMKVHWLHPGTILDNRYYVGRVIGEGGFGITYIGYDSNLNIKIAIKEFFLSGINSRNSTVSNELDTGLDDQEEMFESYREKFINEAQILARFNNQQEIVSVFNFFKSNNTAYIIMEYLDGETLKEYLKKKKQLSVDETLEIFLPIMQTLDKVHSTKLIHRDISPDNIIFTKEGNAKLLDFGAAREVNDNNKSLSVVLKHGYAPPEQYQTHGNQGPWTDVYALSATIYKCLTGNTPPEAMDRMMKVKIEPVCVITSSCSKEMSDVIMRGLELQIEDRYQSMREMTEALKRTHKREVVESKPFAKEEKEPAVSKADDKEKDIPKVVNEFEEKSAKTISVEALEKSAKTISVEALEKAVNVNDRPTKRKHKQSNKKAYVYVLGAIVICTIIILYAKLLGHNRKDMAPAELKETTDGMVENSVEEGTYAYLKTAQVGDIVEFGNYNGFTTWRVLAKSDTELMIIAENVVDRQPFDALNVKKSSWHSCTLRTWLNNEYYNKAFTNEERALIKESDIDGDKDKIFLLSPEEVEIFFKDVNSRIAHNVEYENEYGIEAPNGYLWWLRSPITSKYNYIYGSNISREGFVNRGVHNVFYEQCGVRPTLNIDLSKITSMQIEFDGQKAQELGEEGESIADSETDTEIEEERKIVDLKEAQVGDIVEFGDYNGFTTWRVLAKSDTELMLITENVVDRQRINEKNGKYEWKNCSLRTWLNHDYYNEAFADDEKQLIKKSSIDGRTDKIFLLSSEEAENLFKDDKDRIARNSSGYAETWWLRSPILYDDIIDSSRGSGVEAIGFVGEGNLWFHSSLVGVRPVLNIDISKLQ